jgi:hypothetical protein
MRSGRAGVKFVVVERHVRIDLDLTFKTQLRLIIGEITDILETRVNRTAIAFREMLCALVTVHLGDLGSCEQSQIKGNQQLCLGSNVCTTYSVKLTRDRPTTYLEIGGPHDESN